MQKWQCIFVIVLASGEIARSRLDTPQDIRDLDKFDSQDDDTGTGESGGDLDDTSSERIGAVVTQITRHPYAAALLKNDTYICSSIILNNYWLITQSKCFDADIISSYVTHRNLKNFTIRVGSSYNNKGGTLFKIMMLINNFDLKVSAIKLTSGIEFNARVNAVRLPSYDEEPTLGFLASILAWTPNGHMRAVNAPVVEPLICESYTKLLPGHYICLGGVQDVNRHFCRKDDGGAVIQNNTLIAISSYLHSCAVYSRAHAFPKVSSFTRWLDSVIWDEENRPSTTDATTSGTSTKSSANVTEPTPAEESSSPYYGDPRKFMLTLPFDPINVPLEPSQGNNVLSRMSLYESYLQSMARAKTSTTQDPALMEQQRNGMEMAWMRKYGNAMMMMPPQIFQAKNFENFNDYNK